MNELAVIPCGVGTADGHHRDAGGERAERPPQCRHVGRPDGECALYVHDVSSSRRQARRAEVYGASAVTSASGTLAGTVRVFGPRMQAMRCRPRATSVSPPSRSSLT